MTEQKSDCEKQLEVALCGRIRAYRNDPSAKDRIEFAASSNADFNSLGDLIGAQPFKLIQDNSKWDQHKSLLVDVSGGMTPDIVIQSVPERENRIIIEVKRDHHFGYGRADSQIIRYFLHLLATSLERKKDTNVVRRAVVLAAPKSWFNVRRNKADWEYFWNTYAPLATAFGIVLAEIELKDT